MLIPRTLIFITRGDQVLLIRGAPDKRLWANLYNGIGGHIEQGEDALSAARRELLEETGLSSPDLHLCGTVTIDTGEQIGIGLYVFTGNGSQGRLTPSREGRLEWIRVPDIEALPLVQDLRTLLPRVLRMRKEDPPFSAHYTYDQDGNLIISFG